MGVLRLNVRVIFCILYLMKVVVSQEETVLLCNAAPETVALSKLRQVFKYPETGSYSPGAVCKWLFSSPDTASTIRYRFISISVHCGDILNAYDGDSSSDTKLSGPECSSTPNARGTNHVTTQNNLYVEFSTDTTTNPIEQGFSLEVITGKDLSECRESGSTVTISRADAVVLTSQRFPDNYPANLKCTYIFTAANGVDQIQFDMVYMDLEESTDSCYDFVKLFDGAETLLTELCGTSTSKQSFTSPGSTLIVRFESDGLNSQAGFYANIFTLGEETTTTLTTATETGDDVTTKATSEVTEGETECNRTPFSFWNLCCKLARSCNNVWIFCRTMTQCCKHCGLSSSSFSN